MHELQHGSAGFPMQLYYNQVSKLPGQAEHFIYTHFHHHLEWILITAGEAKIEVDTERWIASAGDLIMVNSGQIHGVTPLPDRSCELVSIVFDLSMLFGRHDDVCAAQFLAPFLNNTYALHTRIPKHTPAGRRMKRSWTSIMHHDQTRSHGYPLIIKAELYNCFYEIMEAGLFHEISSPSPKDYRQTMRIKQILDYIDSNLEKKLTVQELAEHIHISSAHFYTFFRSMTGQTPIAYMNNLRLTRAQSILQTHKLTVQETAARVGFDNVSYFIRSFKNKFGLTPYAFVRSVELN